MNIVCLLMLKIRRQVNSRTLVGRCNLESGNVVNALMLGRARRQ